MKRERIVLIISTLFFILFVDVGLSKLMDNHSFQVQLSNSPLVKDYVQLIAIPIPLAEVIIALSLLFPRLRKIGLIAATILMIVFTGYNIYLLTYGGHLPCGCGGIFKKMDWKTHLIVNSSMTILGGLGVWLSFKDPMKGWINNSKNKASFT